MVKHQYLMSLSGSDKGSSSAGAVWSSGPISSTGFHRDRIACELVVPHGLTSYHRGLVAPQRAFSCYR